jgi:hypothetical protein
MIDSGIQSETVSRFRVGGVVKNKFIATDKNRNIRNLNFELVKNRLHIGVYIDIKIGVRLAVANQEFSQPQRIARMVGSNQYRIAYGVGDLKYPAQ